jgi:hypothetical protein
VKAALLGHGYLMLINTRVGTPFPNVETYVMLGDGHGDVVDPRRYRTGACVGR